MNSKLDAVAMIMIAVGLFEAMVTPHILGRLWAKHPPPNTPYVLRMIRRSGLTVVIFGLAILLNF